MMNMENISAVEIFLLNILIFLIIFQLYLLLLMKIVEAVDKKINLQSMMIIIHLQNNFSIILY
jgi:hypothetical protein